VGSGENGVLVMALVVVAATVLMRTRWSWLRALRQPMEQRHMPPGVVERTISGSLTSP
jgi:hypothetical protein